MNLIHAPRRRRRRLAPRPVNLVGRTELSAFDLRHGDRVSVSTLPILDALAESARRAPDESARAAAPEACLAIWEDNERTGLTVAHASRNLSTGDVTVSLIDAHGATHVLTATKGGVGDLIDSAGNRGWDVFFLLNDTPLRRLRPRFFDPDEHTRTFPEKSIPLPLVGVMPANPETNLRVDL